MSVISYETDTIKVDFGGQEYADDTPDQNSKVLQIGGSTQPVQAFSIRGASGSVAYPSDDYEDEPYTVYLNSRILETGILPSPDTPQVTALTIDDPDDTVTADGTASATVTDQFGDDMQSGYTLEWDCDGTHIATIDESSGAYTVGTSGTGTITCIATDSTKETAIVKKTISVTVSVTPQSPPADE